MRIRPNPFPWLCLLLAAPPPAFPQIPSFQEIVVDPEYLANPWGKAVGDLDGDGDPDLAAGTAYNQAIHWYRHPGWTRHVLCARNGGDDLQLADMDGDGDLDVISNGGTILWHRNPSREGGDVTQPWPIHTVWSGGRSHDLAIGDVDGNGRPDVLIRREMGPTWIIFQTGADRWSPVHLAAASDGTGSALADLDGDGRLDVVENGFWLRQPADPLRSAWTRHDFAAWGPNSAVAVADIDGDGRRDVFLSEAYVASRLSWFKAPADPRSGGWEERVVARPADMIHRFHLADMDRDSRLDIVFAEQHQSAGHRVGILRNADGYGGSWELQVISATGSHNIALGDVGRDGDLDIFGVNWRGDTRPRLWVNGDDGAPPPPPDSGPPPPPPPAGLTATPGDGQVTVEWAPVTGAAGYHLYWREGTTVDKAGGTRIGGASSPVVVENLRNGVVHAFAVSAFDSERESALSPAVTAAPGSPDTPPDPPPDPPPGNHGTPFRGSPALLPGTLEAEDFDLGAEGTAYHDLDLGNQGGQYRSTGVDIGHARDTGAGYYVGWIGTGEWLEYTVRVLRAGPYRLEARVSSPYQGRGFHVEWNGRDVSGPVRAPFTDGWHAWRTHAVDIHLPDTGAGILRVHVDTQGFNLNRLTFVPKDDGGAPPPPPPAPPAPPASGGGDTAQAEDATVGGVLRTSHFAGYTGSGYVDFMNASGDFVEWTVTAGGAGSALLRVRYANADTRSRPLDVYVDGALVLQGMPFPPTGTWTAWAESQVTLPLAEGDRRIRLQAAGSSGPNVDRMVTAPP